MMVSQSAQEQGTHRAVLVVERSGETQVGGWLEEEGFEVLECPGPTGPDYRCIGGRGRRCPLLQVADAVVLDTWLEGDAALEGTSAIDLAGYYLDSGKPVVALTHSDDSLRLFLDEGLVTVSSPPDRREIVETIRTVLPSGQRHL